MAPSEQALHSFCEARGILLTPIPTESTAKNRTPDFLLQIPEAEAVVELKQIDLNDDERAQLAAMELGQTISIDHGGDVTRFAGKIRDANDQLKRKCNGRPGITVLMDARDWLARALSPQQVLAEAMFGRETVWSNAPYPGKSTRDSLVAHDFGRGRTVGPKSNTTTSAAALFMDRGDGNQCLLVHHNPHASVPLRVGLLTRPDIREFTIPSFRSFSEFEEVRAR